MLEMDRNTLGRTGLRLTPLGFGAAPLGNLYREVARDEAYATVDAAWQAGLRYFDTAPYYGFGLSERRLGDMLRCRPRSDYVISSKAGRILHPAPGHEGSTERHGFCSPMPFEPHYDYTHDGIMRSFEDSLQRLGIASIDILLVHDIGEVTHGEANDRHFHDLATSGYRALEELSRSGDVKAIGLGVNEWEICERAMDIGQFDCFLLAGRYTLLEQSALDTFMPRCLTIGASVIIGGAYNSGILATGVKRGSAPHYNYRPAPQAIIDRVADIEELCAAHGVTMAAAALQFPLAHDAVAAVIPGLDSARRVEQTVGLISEAIPASFWSDMKSANLLRADAPTP